MKQATPGWKKRSEFGVTGAWREGGRRRVFAMQGAPAVAPQRDSTFFKPTTQKSTSRHMVCTATASGYKKSNLFILSVMPHRLRHRVVGIDETSSLKPASPLPSSSFQLFRLARFSQRVPPLHFYHTFEGIRGGGEPEFSGTEPEIRCTHDITFPKKKN